MLVPFSITGEYDRIAVVGCLEHVGYKNLDAFYTLLSKHLKPNGLAVVHSITTGRSTPINTDIWIPKYIFPNGYLPSPKMMIEYSEGKLVVEDIQNIGVDYAETLLQWYKNYKKAEKAGLLGDKQNDIVFRRMWEYYLLYSRSGFKARKIHLYQVVYSKFSYDRYDAPR